MGHCLPGFGWVLTKSRVARAKQEAKPRHCSIRNSDWAGLEEAKDSLAPVSLTWLLFTRAKPGGLHRNEVPIIQVWGNPPTVLQALQGTSRFRILRDMVCSYHCWSQQSPNWGWTHPMVHMTVKGHIGPSISIYFYLDLKISIAQLS